MHGTFIPTLKWLASKRAIVNVQSFEDSNCFQYAVLIGINIANSHRQYHESLCKPYLNMLNMHGIPTLVPLSAIDKFEQQNPKISVNVLSFDEQGELVFVNMSKFRNKCKNHANLFMLTDDDDKFHYACVISVSRLIAHRTNYLHKAFLCHYCLEIFEREDQLNQHLFVCNLQQLGVLQTVRQICE